MAQDLLVVFLAWLLLNLILAMLPMKAEVRYWKQGKDDQLSMVLTPWPGVWNYRLDIPVIQWKWEDWLPYLRMEVKTEAPTVQADSGHEVKVRRLPPLPIIPLFRMLAKMPRLLPIGLDILRVHRWFYQTIRCVHLKWVTEVGVEDAADTAILTGWLWAFKGWVFGNLNRTVRVEFPSPEFGVIPSFNGSRLNLDLDCIFAIRTGHIMFMGLRTFWLLLKASAGTGGLGA